MRTARGAPGRCETMYEQRGRLADAVQGAIRPSQVIRWENEAGEAQDLIGATLSGTIRNKTTTRTIEGALTVTDTDVGEFRWDYAANDVAITGVFYVQFTAAFASGRTPARTYEALWVVR